MAAASAGALATLSRVPQHFLCAALAGAAEAEAAAFSRGEEEGKGAEETPAHHLYEEQRPIIVETMYGNPDTRRLFMVFRSPLKPTGLTANSEMPGKDPPTTFKDYYQEK